VIKNDRHYAKNAPLWTCFFSFFALSAKNSGISRRDGDEDEDFGTNNDEETAQVQEIREETERDQVRNLERI